MSRSCESAAQSIEAAAWMARSGDGRSCSGQSHYFSLSASALESFSSWGIPYKRIFRMAWGTNPDVNGATTFIEKRADRWDSTPAPGLLHSTTRLRFRYFPCKARNRSCEIPPSQLKAGMRHARCQLKSDGGSLGSLSRNGSISPGTSFFTFPTA